jgi:hypothetical protein
LFQKLITIDDEKKNFLFLSLDTHSISKKRMQCSQCRKEAVNTQIHFDPCRGSNSPFGGSSARNYDLLHLTGMYDSEGLSDIETDFHLSSSLDM